MPSSITVSLPNGSSGNSSLPVQQNFDTPVGYWDENGTPHPAEADLPGEGYYGGVQHITVTPKPILADVTPDEVNDLTSKYGAAPSKPSSNQKATPSSIINNIPNPVSPDEVNQLTDQFNNANLNKYGMKVMYQAPQDEPNNQGTIANAASGVSQGVKDVANTIGTGIGYLDKLVSKVTGGAGADRANRFEDYVNKQNQAFEQQTGNSTAASVGRVGGQLLATAPFMAYGGAAEGASLAARALPTIAQPLAKAAVAGGVTGGEFGALTNASNNKGIASNVAQNALGGAVAGPVLAAAGSALTKVAPAVRSLWATVGPIRDLTNKAGVPSSAIDYTINVLENAGFTPQTAKAALAKLGPQATLADLDPSIATELGGFSTLGGKPTAIAKSRMQARADTANNNASNLITRELGPKPDIEAEREAIVDQAQKAVAPDYAAAKSSGQKLDVNPIVESIKNKLPSAVGEQEKALKTIGSFFLRKDKAGQFTNEIKDNIEELHGVRIGLDAILNSKNPTTSLGNITKGQVKSIRNDLDALLKTNPQMKAADQKFAEKMEVKKSLDYGNDILRKNGDPKEVFQAKFNAASTEEKEAIRKGVSNYIHEQLEQASKGELPEAQRLFSKTSRNRAILKTAFGSKADTILDTLEKEATFRATEKGVLARSHTAEGQAIQRKIGERNDSGGGYAKEAVKGLVYDMAAGHPPIAATVMTGKKFIGNRVINYSSNKLNARNEGVTDVLSRSGLPLQTTLNSMKNVNRIQKAVTRNNPNIKLPVNIAPIVGKPMVDYATDKYKKLVGER